MYVYMCAVGCAGGLCLRAMCLFESKTENYYVRWFKGIIITCTNTHTHTHRTLNDAYNLLWNKQEETYNEHTYHYSTVCEDP